MQKFITLLLCVFTLVGCDKIAWEETAQAWCKSSPKCDVHEQE